MNPDFDKIQKVLALIQRILRVLCAVIAVLGFLILARSLINVVFLHSYNTGHYYTIPENLLSYLPFGENYVVPYNLGNVEYQKGNYDKAIYYYTLAYQNDPPEHPVRDEQCRIRVNLALSLCHTIDFDHLDLSDVEAVTEAVATLRQARAILTQDGCASEPVGSDEGHYQEADMLKHDIDRMLEKLQNQSQSDQDQDGNTGDGDNDQNEEQSGDEQEQNQKGDNSDSRKTDDEEEKKELERQEKLKEDLEQQKEDLKDGNGSSSSYDYEYIDGSDAKGYGEGTLW